MSIREKCRREGHKFRDPSGMMALPYVFCARWRCSATAVAVWAPPALAEDLHNAIPIEDRFPPIDIRSGSPEETREH